MDWSAVERRMFVIIGLTLVLGSSRAPAELTSAEQKCIFKYNSMLRLVSKQAGKSARICISLATRGVELDPDGCIVNNTDGKIAVKEAKVSALFTDGTCMGSEPIQQSAATGNAAHRQAITDLAHDLFGIFGMPGVIEPGETEARCVNTMAKGATKIFATSTQSFNLCKREQLRMGWVTDGASLGLRCLNDYRFYGKVAQAVFKLRSDVGNDCPPFLDLGTLVPGCASPLQQPAYCIEGLIGCRLCQAWNQADGMNEDCDKFDDGSINNSCTMLP